MKEIINSKIENKNRYESWLEFIILFVVVFIIYFLTLRFIFPGYFNPFIPHHGDFYMFYIASPHETLQTLFMSPRFVGIFIRDIVGILGMKSTIIFLIILNSINITLTILLVKAIAKVKLHWPLIILYLFLIFSHPGFYIKYSYDFFDALAYFFAIFAMFAWYKINENVQNKHLLIIVVLLFLSLFSKETYFLPLFIFWCYQCFFSDRKQRRAAVIILCATALLFILSILHSHFVSSPWVKIENSGTNPYFIDMHPVSIIKTYFYYLKMWGNLGVIGLVAISLIVSLISKKYFKEIILFLILGLLTYVPHSLLPNHKYAYYYWLAIPFTYSVILFINPDSVRLLFAGISSRKVFNSLLIIFYIVIAFFGAFSLKEFNKSYKSAGLQWTLQQENINRNMLESLPIIKNNICSSDKVLLTGLTFPFHPFVNPNYIDTYFGNFQNVKWIVAVYNKENEDKNIGSIEFLGIKKIDLSKYDKIFAFDNEGKLVKIIDTKNINFNKVIQNNISENDLIFYPELYKYINSDLKDSDWNSYMTIGNILSTAYPERGEYFLSKAIESSKDTNPYPYYFMGQLMEKLNRNTEALYDYSKAVELDTGDNKNQAFIPALERVNNIIK